MQCLLASAEQKHRVTFIFRKSAHEDLRDVLELLLIKMMDVVLHDVVQGYDQVLQLLALDPDNRIGWQELLIDSPDSFPFLDVLSDLLRIRVELSPLFLPA